MTTKNTYTARLSPSGPVIGSPPVQVGGGASVPGRLWVKQGAGAVSNVPGTAAGDLLGLESTLVDLRPGVSGYKYDIDLDSETFGTGGNFNVLLLGSVDGGATFTSLHTPSFLQEISGGVRLHITNFVNPNASTINRLKVQLQRDVAAGASLTYAPTMSALRVREYSA